jgi:OmpA-OmpF porin, OOP family
MKIEKVIFPVIILGAISTVAYSQTVNSSWYAAPNFSFVIDSPHREDSVGWATGLALGKVLNDRWNVELGGQFSDFGSNDKQANVGLDALYFFNRNPYFSPYATFGLGYVYEGSSPAVDKRQG